MDEKIQIEEFAARCYAHTLPDCSEELWEVLEKHLCNVAKLSSAFAGVFGANDWGHLVGLWHDLGKYSAAFQEYIYKPRDESGASPRRKGPDHATAGAQHANIKFPGAAGRLLAYCIAGHHAGLPDAEDTQGGRSSLASRLTKQIHSIEAAPNLLLEAPSPQLPAFDWGKKNSECSFRASVFCRMLFSCLVDADSIETERFVNPARTEVRDGAVVSLEILLRTLDANLARFDAEGDSKVNTKRGEVLAACRNKASMPPGIFSLTVPTGGGKTLSSLAFALGHAIAHGLHRVIYAIPFTSIIEQNAQVFRNALNAAGPGVVVEHHSNFERTARRDSQDGDEEESFWDTLASENWDAPLVVTTNVQLFESLFANKRSRCRKLHNIAKSVIILDEVQTLPVNLLTPTLAMLEELCRHYGCTVVLCSATQPAVQWRDDFRIGLRGVSEIVDDVPGLFSALNRVSVERIGMIDDDTVVGRLAGHQQVLCVVNTRGHAAALFELLRMKGAKDVFHLSANMCASHRTDILDQIRHRLDPAAPKPCIVVSTQLVEAGVDIDFPVVYRIMTGIDSIAQAAGRCNREGKLATGQVYVFETQVDPPGELRLRRDLGSETALCHADLLSLEAIEQYFSLLYWMRKDEWDKPRGGTKKPIMDCFSGSKHGLHAQFREAAANYKLIENEQQPVIVPYGLKGKQLIAELTARRDPPGRDFCRRAQRYTVNVYEYQLRKLQESGLVAPYHDERFWVLEDSSVYDREIGLRFDKTTSEPERWII